VSRDASQTCRSDLGPGYRPLRIRTLRLTNFRNFGELSVEFSDRRNVILGANAEGKTNVLDAVHILGVGRSHRDRRDSNLIKFEEEYYRIEGVFDHIGVRTTIEVAYSSEGKRIRVNGKEARGPDLIGLAAVVITSPDDIDLIKGGPQLRRRFLDIAISQTSREYLRTLQQYVRALAQRNVLLRDARDRGEKPNTAVWDRALVETGAKVVALRIGFLESLVPQVEADFNLISAGRAALALVYEPRGYRAAGGANGAAGAAGAGGVPGEGDLAAALMEAVERNREGEIQRGYTLVGPHVDDFRFAADGRDIRQFGSEGEQRTAVLALRCAEASAIRERLGKAPIVLLDDVFAELDDARGAALISLISGFDQIVLTSSRESPLGAEKVHRIHLKDGRVTYDGQA
jgi:DNA replication and repair protein RecF